MAYFKKREDFFKIRLKKIFLFSTSVCNSGKRKGSKGVNMYLSYKKIVFLSVFFTLTCSADMRSKFQQFMGNMLKEDAQQLEKMRKEIEVMAETFKAQAQQMTIAQKNLLAAQKSGNTVAIVTNANILATGLNFLANTAPLFDNLIQVLSLLGGTLDEINQKKVQNIMDALQNEVVPNIKTIVEAGNVLKNADALYEKKAWQLLKAKEKDFLKSVTADDVREAVAKEQATKNLALGQQALQHSKQQSSTQSKQPSTKTGGTSGQLQSNAQNFLEQSKQLNKQMQR